MTEKDFRYVLTNAIAMEFIARPDIVGLTQFTAIEEDAAEVLAHHQGDLNLGGLSSLSDAAAESLCKHKGGGLSLSGLTSLSDKVAKMLAQRQGWLYLGGLSSLSVAAAEALAKHEGPELSIDIDGPVGLSDAAAKALSMYRGEKLFLELSHLSTVAAEHLSQYPGNLCFWFDDCETISDRAIEHLCRRQGFLSFDLMPKYLSIPAIELFKWTNELKRSQGETEIDVDLDRVIPICDSMKELIAYYDDVDLTVAE